ncbi:hypothetical protein OAP45_00090 [Candidatus Pelagibacter sp.]|nr:hypothetical protein [Candidatus Pelagibacter sp.]
MKIILILCKSSYRKNNLNNFSKILFLNRYLIFTLSGLFYYAGLLLKSLKIFKIISIDGDPIVYKNNGFNFWLSGTTEKIPEKYLKYKNNYLNVKAVFHNKDKIFQLYPLINKKINLSNEIRIVYLSSCNLRKPNITSKFVNLYEKFLNKNPTQLDEYTFWNNNNLKNYSDKNKYYIYRDLKLNQRINLIKFIMNKYSKNIDVYGDDWGEYIQNYKKTFFKSKEIRDMYNGNICLDFGSSSGSITLYPRSIDIIESGGLLLQLKQVDSKFIFQENENYFTFSNLEELDKKIQELINNRSLLFNRIRLLQDMFKNSKPLIEKQLDKIFQS